MIFCEFLEHISLLILSALFIFANDVLMETFVTLIIWVVVSYICQYDDIFPLPLSFNATIIRTH
uniref:Uncharacterized protein n=1 Tax=viral metagenome TaxID=1070528 RepID=A0A6C0IZC1_9ZZZZ